MSKSNGINHWSSNPSIFSIILDGLILLIGKHSTLFVVILCCGSGLVFTNLFLLSTNLNKSMAIENAALFSKTLSEFRTLYTSEVVSRVDNSGIDVTHDYHVKEGAIPLPATLSIKLGKSIREKVPGADVRLFSDLPFSFRKDGGPRDDFEKTALDLFKQDPSRPYVRFDEVNGLWSIRYATPDIMQISCVECHNNHPQSPKKDWKVGDVRGVLEVILPLRGVKESTQKGLFGSFLLINAFIILGLILLALAIGGLRRSVKKTEVFAGKETAMNQNLQYEILERKKIETTLAERTAELERINRDFQREINERKKALAESEAAREELEAFNKVAVGRELRMIELKKQINEILQKQGEEKLYDIEIVDHE